MLGDRKVLALIPARGGSKGIPGKNLAPLNGRPLLDYTIDAAISAKRIDDVWVSSNDSRILAVAAARGVHALQRPPQHATDTATAMQVVDHWLSALDDDLKAQDPFLVYLQPTSPLRTARHIEESLTLLESRGAYSLVSVVTMDKSPHKAFTVDSKGKLSALFDERLSNQRRQDLPQAFLPNGAIYVFTLSAYQERGGFPSNGSVPYVMSATDSIDIDTSADLEVVLQVLELKND
jgi:CMP-N-acetylneuraminic acid synthetase